MRIFIFSNYTKVPSYSFSTITLNSYTFLYSCTTLSTTASPSIKSGKKKLKKLKKTF